LCTQCIAFSEYWQTLAEYAQAIDVGASSLVLVHTLGRKSDNSIGADIVCAMW
jgi:hypothetical protein